MLPANPIPQVCNYGSSATYCSCPTDEQIAAGVIPLDSLPAAWWNWMWSKTNQAVNCARFTVGTLITELNTVLAQAGVCSCDACTDQLYQAITKLRRIVGDADYPGAVKSSSTPGQVSIDANGVMTANCVGNATQLATASHTLVGAVNELKTCYDCCISDINSALGGKAPTGHASSNTTYGVGSSSDYGHLKISDQYASVLEACSGVAASQYALATAYSALANAGYTTLGNTVGCALGTAAAGTATTAAHSDHVHPLPTCVACAGTASCLGGLCSTCYEQKTNLGTAAYCAAGCFRASTWTPSLVACSRCVWNRPGSTEASKVCDVKFYAGCSNASCAATNYAACICGSNGWMYGLAGIFTPNIRANDPGSTASKNCCVTITAYCTNAGGDKTTVNFNFCGNGYMHGNVCGNVCGLSCLALIASYACKVYKTAATASVNRQVLLGEATEEAGYGCVYYGNACKLTFNPSNGCLSTCIVYAQQVRSGIICSTGQYWANSPRDLFSKTAVGSKGTVANYHGFVPGCIMPLTNQCSYLFNCLFPYAYNVKETATITCDTIPDNYRLMWGTCAPTYCCTRQPWLNGCMPYGGIICGGLYSCGSYKCKFICNNTCMPLIAWTACAWRNCCSAEGCVCIPPGACCAIVWPSGYINSQVRIVLPDECTCLQCLQDAATLGALSDKLKAYYLP